MRKTSYIPKTYQKKKSQKRSKTSSWIVFLRILIGVGLIGGLIYALMTPLLNIQIIKLELDDDILTKEVISRAEDYLTTQNRWWYNSNNIFLAPVGELEQYLLSEFPQFQDISIQRTIYRELKIQLTPRIALFDICENTQCVSIGEDGVVMPQKLSVEAPLPLITGISFPRIGDTVLNDREMKWLQTILEIYGPIDKVGVASIAIQQRYEDSLVEVFVYTKLGYYIMLDLETDIVYQAEVLKKVLDSQITPEIAQNLEYIDLRIMNRVYYLPKQ
jgi:hypothetical protein